MKVIVSGSRDIRDARWVYRAIEQSRFRVSELVCGGAVGPESLGHHWALQQNPPVPVREFDYDAFAERYGEDQRLPGGNISIALARRNQAMAEYADALVAVTYDPVTPGTLDLLERMRALAKLIYVSTPRTYREVELAGRIL